MLSDLRRTHALATCQYHIRSVYSVRHMHVAHTVTENRNNPINVVSTYKVYNVAQVLAQARVPVKSKTHNMEFFADIHTNRT